MIKPNKDKFIPVMTIAGSDNSGGAGIQADLKTFWAHGCFGLSAIAAITAQNIANFSTYQTVTPELLYNQIKLSVLQCKPLSIKTGMLATSENISTVCNAVREFDLPLIVVDPVMKSSTEHNLATDEYINNLRKYLLPLAYVVTPNKMEAELLSEVQIDTHDDLVRAATKIHEMGAQNVIIKGGHLNMDRGESVDVLYDGKSFRRFSAPKKKDDDDIEKDARFHGTGCTFSAALCACIAMGYTLDVATDSAKKYVLESMQNPLPGTPSGILNH